MMQGQNQYKQPMVGLRGMNQNQHTMPSTQKIMLLKQNLATLKSTMIQSARREYTNTIEKELSMKLTQMAIDQQELSQTTSRSWLERITSMYKVMST